MRIVWISSVSPLPATDGNRLRHFHLLRETASGHEVVLICSTDRVERDALQDLRELGIELRLVGKDRAQRGRIAAGIRRQPACLVPPDIDALVETAAQAGRFDIAFGDLSAAIAVASTQASRRVLDDQNVEAHLYERLWRAESLRPRKFARLIDWRAVRRYEGRWLQMPDAVTVCSEQDAQQLAKVIPDQRFCVVPNGVDLDVTQFHSNCREPETIVFVGGMSWAPNVDAVSALVNEIMPTVWQERPAVQLWLVGKDPVREVQELAGPRVFVTGAVESVLPYLRRATVTVIPLRSGGGTRLKILEAMAAGLPVVSTTVGAEGLGLRSGVEALIADSVSELAASILELLDDGELARSVALAARRRVERDFGWDAIGTRLTHVFAQLGSDRALSPS